MPTNHEIATARNVAKLAGYTLDKVRGADLFSLTNDALGDDPDADWNDDAAMDAWMPVSRRPLAEVIAWLRAHHPEAFVQEQAVYGTSPLKRTRRTKAELEEIDIAIYDIAKAERPVTVRGLFYRVMSRGLVPKNDQGYSVVQRQALKLRRVGELPYAWITDGSRVTLKPKTYSSAQAALENTARTYRQDLWIDQGVHVEVWSEKDAIRGVVYPVTSKYDVPLMISRGYSSETFLWATAEDINDEGCPAVIYHLGDHDRDGVRAWNHIERKLREFVDDDIDLTFERIAVTPEQITELSLPTRHDKTDSGFGACVEVDAIPSPTLRELVSDAIEGWINPEQLRITKIAEQSERDILNRISNRDIA